MRKAQLFVVYAPEDISYKQKFSKHLTALKDAGYLHEWSEGEILPGADIDDSIRQKMNESDIIVLLISADFLASEQCRRAEDLAFAYKARRGVILVPVILRACVYHSSYNQFKILPDGIRPVSDTNYWGSEDNAFTNVAEGLKRLIESMQPAMATSASMPSDFQTKPIQSQKQEGAPRHLWLLLSLLAGLIIGGGGLWYYFSQQEEADFSQQQKVEAPAVSIEAKQMPSNTLGNVPADNPDVDKNETKATPPNTNKGADKTESSSKPGSNTKPDNNTSSTPPPQTRQNLMNIVQVSAQSDNELVVEVNYYYNGDKGDRVYMALYAMKNGAQSPYFGYRPAQVNKGRGTARVSLTTHNTPQNYATDQLKATFYGGGKGSFFEKTTAYSKVWNNQQSSNPPSESGTSILAFRIVSESARQIVVDIDYKYDGSKGDNVAISAIQANDNQQVGWFGYRPDKVNKGSGTARITLSALERAPFPVTTNQLKVSIYVGGGKAFSEKFFPYKKTWR